MNAIANGDRHVDSDFQEYLKDFIIGYCAEKNDFETYGEIVLSEKFRSRKFSPDDRDKAYEASFSNPLLLDVGEEYYPLKK